MLARASRAVRRWWLHPGLRHGRKCARLCRRWCAPVARSLAAACGGRASHASGCACEHLWAPADQARRRPGRPCPHPHRPRRAGRPGRSPPCRPAPGASSAAWSVCSSMARAGTAAAGSSGVTGAAGAAAAWGALFTARARCSRRRETWSIFFVSNFFDDFFKEQFGSLKNKIIFG